MSICNVLFVWTSFLVHYVKEYILQTREKKSYMQYKRIKLVEIYKLRNA